MPWAFILRKFCRAFFTLSVIVTFVFVILRTTGDPATQILGTDATQEALEAFREKWGLNDPIWQQYLRYVWGLLHGDFGVSIITKNPVLHEFLTLFPATVELSICALLFAIMIGIPAGVIAASLVPIVKFTSD